MAREKQKLPTKLEFTKRSDELGNIIHNTTTNPIEYAIVLSTLELLVQLLKKNKAYGNAVFTAGLLAPDMDSTAAIRIRLGDKIRRLNSLIGNPSVDNLGESIKETVFDLTGYGSLWHVLLAYDIKPEDLT